MSPARRAASGSPGVSGVAGAAGVAGSSAAELVDAGSPGPLVARRSVSESSGSSGWSGVAGSPAAAWPSVGVGAARSTVALIAALLMVGAGLLVACGNGDGAVSGAPRRGDDAHESARSTGSTTSVASTASAADGTGAGSTVAGVAGAATPSSRLADAACVGALKVADAGRIASSDITEASGLVASWLNDGVWWITNDSGDSARIFAVDVDGGLLATVALDGAVARDWEALAIGPPMAGLNPTLYVGDTGDNAMMSNPARGRSSLRVNRLTEPVIDRDVAPQRLRARVEVLTLRFPDGPHDVEAMLVDPVAGDLVFVTKDWTLTGVSGVYRAPAGLDDGSTTVLERVGEVRLPPSTLVTDVDVTRDGSLVALRSYTGVDLYRRPSGAPVWAAFSTTPCAGPSPGELQGESIGFAPDGGWYMTVSEGMHPVLHRTAP